jgi:hypothetical protein
MSDVTLPDGQEITFDFDRISIDEYRKLFDKDTTDKEGDEILGKVAAIKVDAKKMGARSFMILKEAFWKRAANPLSDPNSPSVPSQP